MAIDKPVLQFLAIQPNLEFYAGNYLDGKPLSRHHIKDASPARIDGTTLAKGSRVY